jgi:branched-chain amino acid transport system permease protein
MKKVIKWILWIALGLALLIYPKVAGIFYTNFFVTFAIMAVFASSFNLELGFTRLLNFGHAMFFGMGGYGAALALTHIPGMPLLGAVGAGLFLSALLAAILCPLIVRVSGTAFAMLHVAFAMLLYMLALKLRDITGGEDGIGGFPIPAFLSINMKDPTNFYYFAVAVLGLSLWLIWFITKTPFGQVMLGIRDNPKRINYLGYKVTYSKALVYILGGAFAGVAGAVYALFQNLIAVDAFGMLNSFIPVLMTMVGGIGTIIGPIIGAGFFQVLEEVASRYTDRVELVVGLILIIIVMFAPLGFMGFYRELKAKWASAPKG